MDYTSIKVGQLPTDEISGGNFIPHEVAGILKKATFTDLAAFIGANDAVGFRAVSVQNGGTLPTTSTQEFILVGAGTYNNVGGGSQITVTEQLNALVSNGTYWFIGVEIPIEAPPGNAIWGQIIGTLSQQTDLQNLFNLKADLVDGKVPSSQLPSYVDDVIEVANYAALPVSGETAKIYVTLDNNKIYRWSGSTYIEIAENNAVWGAITGTLGNQTDLQNALDSKEDEIAAGTTSQYLRGDKSWQTLNKTAVGLGSVDNTTDLNKPISTATQNALDLKANLNSPTFTGTVSGITKSMVGLGNVDNTTDLNKPISTATQTALDLKANNNVVVKLTTDQSISGKKSFNLVQSGYNLSLITSDIYNDGFIESNNGMLRLVNNTTGNDLFRLESDGSLYAKSFVKSGGTSSQYLMADGSVSTGSGGTVTGTGTTNYIPKFTGASAIGNSQVFDNGTSVGINTATPSSTFVLDVHSRDNAYNTRLYQPSTSTGAYSSLFVSGAMTGAQGYFGVGGSATGNVSFRDNVVVGSQSVSPLVFNTSDVERMRITSGGELLVNTTSSLLSASGRGVLEINGSTSSIIGLKVGNAVGSYLYSTSTSTELYSTSDLKIAVAGAERMRIFANGNTFIGTSITDAGFKLDVNGTGRFNGSLQVGQGSGGTGTATQSVFQDTFGGNREAIYVKNTADYSVGRGTGYGFLSGTGTQKGYIRWSADDASQTGYFITLGTTNSSGTLIAPLTLASSGTAIFSNNVGIGVSPSAWGSIFTALEINGGSIFTYNGNPALQFVSNAYFDSVGWKYKNNGGASLYVPANDGNHKFYSAPSGTAGGAFSFVECMSLSASGVLEVKPSASTNAIKFGSIAAGGGYNMVSLNGTNVEGQYIGIAGGGGTDTNFYYQSGNAGSHNFRTGDGTNYVDRMRIFANGNVFIGSSPTDAGYKFDVNGTGRFNGTINATRFISNVTNNYGFVLNRSATNIYNGMSLQTAATPKWFLGMRENLTSNNYIIYSEETAQDVLTLNVGTNAATFIGTVTATGFFNSSDNRLKDLIDYDYNVSDIKPITYLWKDGRDNKKHVGYSAQEVQKAMPDAVNEGTDGMLSVNYVEVLVAKIAELENRIKQLEK